MEGPAAETEAWTRERVTDALRQRRNWEQLAKFGAVGAVGYLVNLGIYIALRRAGIHYIPAAIGSFVVAVTNNYGWNRVWTFRRQRGHMAYQGLRFLVVSLVTLGANLAILYGLVHAGFGITSAIASACAGSLPSPA